MALTVKKMFIIDALGAVVSGASLGVLLPRFQPQIGMPMFVLYILGAIACGFLVNSTRSYLQADQTGSRDLKWLIVANLSYCVLTFGLVLYFWNEMKPLGVTYFFLEILVIFAVVGLERWVWQKHFGPLRNPT